MEKIKYITKNILHTCRNNVIESSQTNFPVEWGSKIGNNSFDNIIEGTKAIT